MVSESTRILREDTEKWRSGKARDTDRGEIIGGPIGLVDRPRCKKRHVDSNGVEWQCALYPIYRKGHVGSCSPPTGYTPPERGGSLCVHRCCS